MYRTPVPSRVFAILAVLAAAITISQTANATSFLWSGASPVDTNWSTALNWTPNGSPGGADTVTFGSAATTGGSTTVNNAISVNTIVTALNYTNTTTGAWHVTDIPAGLTLTATNVTMGGVSGSTGLITDVAMTDAGTFAVNGNLTIGNTPTANSISVVDFSGLSNFVYNASSGTISIGPVNFSLANVTLAQSNNITAGTVSVNFNATSSSSTTTFTLGGQTNTINAGTFNVAAGRNSTTVAFPAGSTGGLRVRGSGGTDASLANMTLGFHNTSGGGSHSSGILSFNGNPVDMRLGTLALGRSDHTPTGNSFGLGSITFDTGTVYASNVVMASTVGTIASAGQYFSQGIGAVNVGANGKFIIGSGGMTMVNQTNNLASSVASQGGVTINGGTVISSNSITKLNTSGFAGITNNTGTLTLVAGTIGTVAVPIDNMVLSGGALHLIADGAAGTANINVTALAASGPVTITIDSIANITVPTTIHLIAYNTTSSGGDQFSGFTLTPLSGGYTGNLVDNSGFIDLSIAPAGTSIHNLQWIGAVGSTLNSSWNFSTANWRNTNGSSVTYTNPDLAHFDDTASNSVVTLGIAGLSPSSFTFTNAGVGSGGLDYTLNGAGSVGGTVGLVKDGAGTVTLSESGGDNFSGGININNGTVILDDANSAISGGFSINSGGTLQVGNNDANGNVPAGLLQNSGSLIVNQSSSESVTNAISGTGTLTKLGSGALTLTSTNGYNGNTVVFGGTLVLSGVGSISNSSSVIVSNSTLDLSGVSKTALMNSLSTSNSTLVVAVSNLSLVLNVVNGNWIMGGTTNKLNVTALPAIASYPTTIAIAQCPGGVSGFNMGIGSLPAASPAFTGNVSLSGDNTTVLLNLTAGPISVRPSVLWIGTNNVSTTTNWSDRLNWQLPGAPTIADNVLFAQNGAAGGSPFNSVGDGHDGVTNPQNINNFVDATTSIGTLVYTNVGGASFSQNTFIANGATLNILSNGSLTVGSSSSSVDFGAGATEFVTIGGTNGTLNVNNTNGTIYVGLGNANSGTESATLDLSGLGTFNASVSRFLVGVGSGAQGLSLGRVAGTVYLAQTNVITAGIILTNTSESSDTLANTMAFNVGEDDGNAGGASALYLGQTNAIFADAVGTGREKTGAGMLFNPNLINNNTQPSAWFRGANSNVVSVWSIGDQVVNSGSGETAVGTNDFTGGRVNALVDTMYIGRASGSATGSGTTSGTLSFDNGIFNVNTLFVGNQPTNSAKIAIGTINVKTNSTQGKFATLTVNGTLSLGVTTAGATAAATANLNIDGGFATVGTVVCGGTNSITLGASGLGGVLVVSNTLGALGAPVGTLTLNGNTVLALPAASPAPAVVNTLTIDGTAGTTNKLNILSLGTVTPPAEVPVIQYSTLNNSGGVFNLGLGTLPAGYSGVFTNDTTHSTIGVIITAVPVTGPSTNATITKVSLSGTNLLVHGTNNNVPNTSFHFVALTTSNLTNALTNWTPVFTNIFNPDGTFDYTNPIVPGTPRQFIDIEVVP
jgi:fibronectin-binding autotransporter adhesin